jgi:NADH:ubiquinone oxidoreductase subunit 2 (subunit N)
LLTDATPWAYALAIVGAVNSVIAFGYYGNVMREIWMRPVPHGDTSPIVTPSSLRIALGLTSVVTLVAGVLPGIVLHFGDVADLVGAFGS